MVTGTETTPELLEIVGAAAPVMGATTPGELQSRITRRARSHSAVTDLAKFRG